MTKICIYIIINLQTLNVVLTNMEYYPSLKEILSILGSECILVGSATEKELPLCKDIDFVVSQKGWNLLSHFEYFLYKEDKNWRIYVPLEVEDKAVDFFFGICNIFEHHKHNNRLTYEEAQQRLQKTVSIEGVEVLSL